MKKIAFFVEGLTEQLFLKKLLKEIFTANRIAVHTSKISGGVKTGTSFSLISAESITEHTAYFVLIYDCGGDSAIRSHINDQRESLIKSNYCKIIGIRDAYPDVERNQIILLKQRLKYGLPQVPIQIEFIIPTMEIEAWFLAENTHFARIDPKLTMEFIMDNLGFDPSVDCMESRDEPAKDLCNCYQLVGKTYKKKEVYFNRTIESIDFSEIYFSLPTKVSSLKELIDEIDEFSKL